MKVLIIGASSFLGRKVDIYLSKERISTVGTYFMNSLEGEKYKRLNLLSLNETKGILCEVAPDVVIMLSALSTVEECEEKKSIALEINTFSVGCVAEWCLTNSKHLVFISSECVFDGLSSPYYEWSQHSPINFYGKTKALAEEMIKTMNCSFAIIRLPLLYGYNCEFDKDTLLRRVVKNLSNEREILLDNKRIKYPILIDNVAKGLIEVIKENLRGIFHFSSQDALTKFEFGLEVANVFGFNKSLVRGMPMEESISIPKPYKIELVDTHLQKLNFLGVRKGLSIVKEQILEHVGDIKRAYA